MILFLDIEASGLSVGSEFIEIYWVDETGAGESHLIRPTSGWTKVPTSCTGPGPVLRAGA